MTECESRVVRSVFATKQPNINADVTSKVGHELPVPTHPPAWYDTAAAWRHWAIWRQLSTWVYLAIRYDNSMSMLSVRWQRAGLVYIPHETTKRNAERTKKQEIRHGVISVVSDFAIAQGRIGIVGNCLRPTTSKGLKKDGCKIFW